MNKLCLALGLFIALVKPSYAQEQESVEIKIIYAGDVTAHFFGYDFPLEPRELRTTKVGFTFGESSKMYFFKPKGNLVPENWSYEIFSEGLSYVSLQSDKNGPFVILDIGDMQDYLEGKPVAMNIAGKPDQGETCNLVGSHWKSDTEFVYFRHCEADFEKRVFVVSEP